MNQYLPDRPFKPLPLGYDPEISCLFGRHPCILPVGMDEVAVRFGPPVLPEDDWNTVSFTLGEHAGECIVPPRILHMLLHAAEPTSQKSLDPTIVTLLLEFVLDSPLTTLEKKAGSLIRLNGIQPSVTEGLEAGHDIGLHIDFGTKGTFQGLLRLEKTLLPLVRALALPLVSTFPEPPICLSLQLDGISVSANELVSLLPGGGLVLGPRQQTRFSLIAGGKLGVHVKRNGTELTLQGPMRPLSRNLPPDWIGMNDQPTPQDQTPPVALHESTIEQLQIALTFELARIPVSLGDLRNMGEGHVIDIGTLDERSVSILANGRRIGEGELVDIGESAAVRITRIITA